MVNFMGYELDLPSPWDSIAANELRIWKKYYVPVDPKGLTVLDVGAGAGETAAFYRALGAKKVIAIQPDFDSNYPSPLKALRRNAEVIGNVEVIPEYFKLEHMDIPHDLLKMDGEACEVLLYDWHGELKPCMIETHGNEITDKLLSLFPLKRVYPLSKDRHLIWLVQLKSSPLPEYVIPEGSQFPEDRPDYLGRFEP